MGSEKDVDVDEEVVEGRLRREEGPGPEWEEDEEEERTWEKEEREV